MRPFGITLFFLSLFLSAHSQVTEQLIHVDLLENGTDRRYEILGATNFTTIQNSQIEDAQLTSSSNTADWITLNNVHTSDDFIATIQTEVEGNNDIKIQFKDNLETALHFDGNTVRYIFRGFIESSDTYLESDIFKVVVCQGQFRYYKNSTLVSEGDATQVGGDNIIIKCNHAESTEVFLQVRNFNSCEVDDMLYYVPKFSFNSNFVLVDGDELGLQYIEKYALGNDGVYSNENVTIVIKDLDPSAPNEILLSTTVPNKYGLNNHTIDISGIKNVDKQFLLVIEGSNKGKTLYLPFKTL